MSLDWEQLERDGFTIVPNVLTSSECVDWCNRLMAVFAETTTLGESVRHKNQEVYAARNVIALCPEVLELCENEHIQQAVCKVLGKECGLVRALFFDKPPQQTWALPWHKDLLIAVADGTPSTAGYSPPRPRAGVLHTEPPVTVLEEMLTVRLHLDDVDEENGALSVLRGSHRTGKQVEIDLNQAVAIHTPAGDALAMRPLLLHCSGRSDINSRRHRRILHLEFSAHKELPEGIEWNFFSPVLSRFQ